MERGRPAVLERVAEWVAGVRWEDVPPRVLDLARHQAISVAASVLAGSRSEEASAVRRAALGWGGPGRATVFPTGERTGVHEAILANSAASMVHDFDDYLYLGHTGHTAVLAAWALAEDRGLSARQALLAQVVANEVGGRLGASSVLGPQNGQAWSFLHAAAGAALASKLLGLDARRTAHALAIALYQPPFTLWPGFMGPGSKVLTAGWPAVAGVQAASLAREGLTGALDVLERPRQGFWASMTYVPVPHLMGGLGTAWVSDSLSFKIYPGCAYLDTTMDALFEILSRYRASTGRALAAEDVERVEVRASLLTVEMENLSSEPGGSGPLSPSNVNFSVASSVAVGILAGRLSAAEMEPGFLAARERDVRDLARRVSLAHDAGMTLEAAGALDEVLGPCGIAASLRLRDWIAVLSGYRRRLGGPRPYRVRLAGLLLRPGALASRAVRLASWRGRGSPDLAAVDFSRFRMVFPARVTLVTRTGDRFDARRDVPRGAAGDPGRLEAARSKLPPGAALEAIARFDDLSLEEVVAALRS